MQTTSPGKVSYVLCHDQSQGRQLREMEARSEILRRVSKELGREMFLCLPRQQEAQRGDGVVRVGLRGADEEIHGVRRAAPGDADSRRRWQARGFVLRPN